MKLSILMLLFSFFSTLSYAQRQLDIEGAPNSQDTVAKIVVPYGMNSNIIGLSVHSEPWNYQGIGGDFYGGTAGVIGRSKRITGVHGWSETSSSTGVRAESEHGTGLRAIAHTNYAISALADNYYAATFQGGPNHADIILGGSEGTMVSSPAIADSDLRFESNDDHVFVIDRNEDEDNGFFRITTGGDIALMSVYENGDIDVWGTINQSSDRNKKEEIQDIDDQEVLTALQQVPVYEWQYIGQGIKHIGPMAQDFHEAFKIGTDTTITTIDLDGVLLAGVRALSQLVEEQRRENATLKRRLDLIETRMTATTDR